jgi:hypothetical protein
MKPITDDDLTLLFYGEHEEPELAARVAASKELSARFEALSAELGLADQFVPPFRGDDYGADVWQQISPRLEERQQGQGSWWNTWPGWISRPRFSLAGALSLVLVAALAFVLGRHGMQEPANDLPYAMGEPSLTLTDIDADRLLSRSVSSHLDQVNLMLTQFVNNSEASSNEAKFATDMLVANRLYRQSATSKGKHKLAAFLGRLEPLLIEMAYEAHSASSASRERMQNEVREGLLFRVRIMNKQLNKPEISA